MVFNHLALQAGWEGWGQSASWILQAGSVCGMDPMWGWHGRSVYKCDLPHQPGTMCQIQLWKLGLLMLALFPCHQISRTMESLTGWLTQLWRLEIQSWCFKPWGDFQLLFIHLLLNSNRLSWTFFSPWSCFFLPPAKVWIFCSFLNLLNLAGVIMATLVFSLCPIQNQNEHCGEGLIALAARHRQVRNMRTCYRFRIL